MSNQCKIIIELINNAMFGTPININGTDNINYGALYFNAQRHKVTNLVYLGLKNNAERLNVEKDVLAAFEKMYKLNLMHSSNQDFVLEELKDLLNENNIPFMPLKGSVLKELYPQSYYRTMSDIDILYKANEVEGVDKILKKNEFIKKEEKEKDVIYTKYGILIELHKALMTSGNKYYWYCKNIWEKAVLKEQTEYILAPEDFLIFHMIHMANHCANGGIGIRFFLDIKIYLDKYKNWLNWDYYNNELQKLGLHKFSERAIHLSNVWFGEEQYEESDDLFMKYVFVGGVYGSEYNSIAVRKVETEEKNGKYSNGRLIFNTLFPSYNSLKQRYGWLKSPLLLPLGWAKLNFERLTRFSIAKNNAKIMMSDQGDDVDDTRRLLDELGLR